MGCVLNRKWLILLGPAFIIIMVINSPDSHDEIIHFSDTMSPEKLKNWRGLTDLDTKKMSTLGRILFLQEDAPKIINADKQYQILIWKYWNYIENRHLKRYGKQIVDPFEDCSVRNCKITNKDDDVKSADMVIFHMQRLTKADLPKEHRKDQIWTFLTDESPYHTFLKKNNMSNYNGVFNWSMTYRMDADIPVPYGRTLLRKDPSNVAFKINKRRDVLVTVLASNCGSKNRRWEYVKELQKHIKVDFYGHCGTLKTCPGHFTKNCGDIDNYMFYLAFENGNCREYITEKAWWNAFEKGAIPIVMGADKASYRKLLPPGSYLNIEDFAKPQDLAAYIQYLNATEKFQDYYAWKRHFEVRNEHGYFGSRSYHLCRACEALNYNDKSEKSYKELDKYWNKATDCFPAWNT